MKNQVQVLLLEDVDALGRSGDIVNVKPGYARNFLLHKKKAMVAEKHLVRLQAKLREERARQAAVDKKEAEALAKQLQAKTLKTEVKIDAEGHMYGSVSQADVAALMKEQLKVDVDKRRILLPKPIKKLGEFDVELKLKEGIPAKIKLVVAPSAEQ